MKSIKISFIQATEKRPCRMVATDGEGHRLYEPYEFENADKQAEALAKKFQNHMKWPNFPLVLGSFKNDWYAVLDRRNTSTPA